MQALEVLARLGLDDPGQALTPYWDKSQARWPASGIGFLQPQVITRTRAFAGLEAAVDAALLEAAAQIRASAALSALAWHCNHLIFQQFEYPAAQTRHWPDSIPLLGDLAGAFYLLIALDAIPRMLAAQQARQIPATISRACCSHYPTSVQIYAEQNNGRVGVQPRALYWLRNHVRGDLFRLGRLEYMVKPFGGHLVAWRHRQTRAVVALAADRIPYDDAGIIVADPESASWRASLTTTVQTVTGTPISPLGYARRAPITLSRDEWEPVLTAGDPILEVHIPAGGGMTPAHCHSSMQQALTFFPQYFPDRPFVGFACGSWILNPELAQIYRPDS
ncbi:MAG: acyltransferase domain-containing protein, partial [bacterium]|nr:acyltransferase domain-containing protein [bacterium]